MWWDCGVKEIAQKTGSAFGETRFLCAFLCAARGVIMLTNDIKQPAPADVAFTIAHPDQPCLAYNMIFRYKAPEPGIQ